MLTSPMNGCHGDRIGIQVEIQKMVVMVTGPLHREGRAIINNCDSDVVVMVTVRSTFEFTKVLA